MYNKTIKIDPSFFKIGRMKQTLKNSKSLHNKNNRNLIKPNKVKKELINKIKNHRKLEKLQNNTHNKDSLQKFNDDFNDSLNYIQNILEKKRKKTEKKRERKEKRNKKKLIDSSNNKIIINDISKNYISKNYISKNNYIQKGIITENKKSDINHNIGHNITYNSGVNNIQNNQLIKEEPPYGCLKGGKKPTYSQYKKTLKNKNNIEKNISNISKIINQEISPVKKQNNQEISLQKSQIENRKQKLNKLKNKHKIKSLVKRFKKYRIKTIHRTYKLGKINNKVSVLIKNNKTIKKIDDEIQLINKLPIKNIRKYLREKNLIKHNTESPENVLREIFKNSLLSGDISNKNKKLLFYNYFN